MKKKTVPDMLKEAAKLYEEKNKIYGDNYKRFGSFFACLFPDGLEFSSSPETRVNEFNRLGVLVQMIGKLTRYSENFLRGGHEDSLDDLCVYSMMLKELDREQT